MKVECVSCRSVWDKQSIGKGDLRVPVPSLY